MKLASGSFLCCCVVVAYAAPKIIGGDEAEDCKYPFKVYSLRDSGKHFCGGSILNTRYGFSLLHTVLCLESANAKVVAGTNLIEGGQEQVYRIEYTVHHRDLNKPSFYHNDIGLIRVDKDIEFNEKVQPIKLPSEDFSKENSPVVVIGWGVIELGDSGSPVIADGFHIGIVSFSQLCMGIVPDVATRVYKFLDWIAAEQAKF